MKCMFLCHFSRYTSQTPRVDVGVCSWPGGVILAAFSARLHPSLLCSVYALQGAKLGSALRALRPLLLHSLHLVQLHGPLKVLKAGLVTVCLFQDPVPVLLGGHLGLESSNRPLHVLQA